LKLSHIFAFLAAFALHGSADAQSWNLTTLYSFQGGTDGHSPNSLMLAAGGSLYGTTSTAITLHCSTCGTVFQLTPPSGGGTAWAHTTLFGFPDEATDGETPTAVIMGPAGTLFGAAAEGGPSTCSGYGCGTVFELTPGAGGWTDTVLLDFGGSKGQMPTGALLLGPNGALYGTASQLAYELRPPSSGSGAWTEHQLYSFTGATGDAYSPQSGFVAGPGPVLYGQSVGGGASNLGTVYQLTPPAVQGGAWTENVLYSFQGGTDGSVPVGPLVRSSTGVLYGTTSTGGSPSCFQHLPQPGCGTVFQLTPPAGSGGTWTETVLYSFTDGTDGGYPSAGVVLGANGVLYGTTTFGGTGSCEESCGTVFQLTPPALAGGTWTETVLYSFPVGSAGSSADAIVIPGPAGALYGVAGGGAYGEGQVFELTP